MTVAFKYSVVLFMMLGLAAAGCSSKQGEPAANRAEESEHDHATTGPHGGDLIELGNEEYHAELIHEDKAVVHLLDSAAKAAVPIDASEVVINLSHDGQAQQFVLAATPDAQDPAGKSSRFIANDADLLSDLKEGHAAVQLVVIINGTQYRGGLEHKHERHDQ